MRFLSKAALAALVAMTGLSTASQAQTPQTPDAPIPYESLRTQAPRPQAPARRAAAPVATTPAAETAETAATTPRIDPAALEAYLDGAIGAAMDRDRLAGVTVAVVQGGETVLKKGYGAAGLSPRRPVDPDRTLFRIGSISKTFTWILLMEEIRAGRIRKDAPVNLYLPEDIQVRDQGFHSPVQVVHLMDHSPGFEDRVLGQLMERRFDRERPLAQYLRQERPRRVREPGQFPTYSNYGVGLAGQAVAYVAGQPFEALVEQKITLPLGMSRTTFREPHPGRPDMPAPMAAGLAADLSQGFRWTSAGGFQARDFEYFGHLAPAGSASSTAADMARYMLMLLGDGVYGETVVFGPETARAFRTPLRPQGQGLNDWPHGFIAYTLPGGRQGYGHTGKTLSFTANMVVVPELDLGVFVAVNTEGGGRLTAELPALIVGQFYGGAGGAPPPRPELAQMASVYEGRYLGTRRAYGGLERFIGFVRSGRDVTVASDGRLIVSSLDGRESYTPEGDPAGGRFISSDGAYRLVFDLNQGRATAFRGTFNDALFQRVGLWSQPKVLILLAGLTAAAAVATLGGLAVRDRRDLRQTQNQSRASLIQTLQAGLWLTAMGLFGAWLLGTGDTAEVVYSWPGVRLVLASACALVAALLTVLDVLALLSVWRGGRRLDSWSLGRKVAFTFTTLIYAAFSVVLLHWGALTPWHS